MDNIQTISTDVTMEDTENIQPVDIITKSETEYKPKPVYDFFKRVFDIVSSFIVSVILIIPIFIISVLIIIKDGWNPFYKHKRVGKDFKNIDIYKFRSMKKMLTILKRCLHPNSLLNIKKSIN